MRTRLHLPGPLATPLLCPTPERPKKAHRNEETTELLAGIPALAPNAGARRRQSRITAAPQCSPAPSARKHTS
jgi:hypothetical protein